MTKKKVTSKAAAGGPSKREELLARAGQALLDNIAVRGSRTAAGQKQCRLLQQAIDGDKFSKEDDGFMATALKETAEDE